MIAKRLVAVTGVSGVGKSTVISQLLKQNSVLCKLPIYTNRASRAGDNSKISLTQKEVLLLQAEAKNVVMTIYDNVYIIKYNDFSHILSQGKLPITDWPRSQLHLLDKLHSQILHIHLTVTSQIVLIQRMRNRGSTEIEIQKRIALDSDIENQQVDFPNTISLQNDDLDICVANCQNNIKNFVHLTNTY